MPKATKTTIDPILYEPPTVTVNGVEYPLRRLGLRDVFLVSRILGRGIAVLTSGEEFHPSQVLQVLLTSLTSNEDEVLKLLASVLSIKRETLEDPTVFPMSSIITVVEALAQHQDLKEFLGNVQALATRLPEMQTRSDA